MEAILTHDRPAAAISPLAARLRIGLAAVFAWGAGAKAFWPAEFGSTLETLGFFPPAAIVPLQFAVPLGEAALAIALINARAPMISSCAALFLSMAFVGMHGMAYYDGVFVPCGCVGLGFEPEAGGNFIWMLSLSILMTLAAATLAWIVPKAPMASGGVEGAARPQEP